MRITIDTVDNGFIISSPHPTADGQLRQVIEIPDCEYSNPSKEYLEKLSHLLYSVLEGIGYYGSKHHEYRLQVEVVDQSHDV